MPKTPRLSILQFQQRFPSNDVCLERIFRDRFGKPTCPVCNRKDKYYKVAGRARYTCACGKHHIHPKSGTVFEGSDTDLVKWLFAIYLFSQSRNGVSALELSRELGVSYKCAWRIAKAVRSLMLEDPVLSGQVESDDGYMGWSKAGKRGRGAGGKTIVLAQAERGGAIRADVIPDVKGETITNVIEKTVAKGSLLMTDGWPSYKQATRELKLEHKTVDHAKKLWANPDGTHVNTVEAFFGQTRRSLDGTYHWVSQKYLPLYLAEFAFRQTHGRREDVHLFDLLLARAATPPRA